MIHPFLDAVRLQENGFGNVLGLTYLIRRCVRGSGSGSCGIEGMSMVIIISLRFWFELSVGANRSCCHTSIIWNAATINRTRLNIRIIRRRRQLVVIGGSSRSCSIMYHHYLRPILPSYRRHPPLLHLASPPLPLPPPAADRKQYVSRSGSEVFPTNLPSCSLELVAIVDDDARGVVVSPSFLFLSADEPDDDDDDEMAPTPLAISF
mmetsp:Transcript_21984/g.47586  ORF Transcript_21984/g.47586 Transcript_21984/m.47586 type:complete len:207 (-) Transcript_21984:127-747(-)